MGACLPLSSAAQKVGPKPLKSAMLVPMSPPMAPNKYLSMPFLPSAAQKIMKTSMPPNQLKIKKTCHQKLSFFLISDAILASIVHEISRPPKLQILQQARCKNIIFASQSFPYLPKASQSIPESPRASGRFPEIPKSLCGHPRLSLKIFPYDSKRISVETQGPHQERVQLLLGAHLHRLLSQSVSRASNNI